MRRINPLTYAVRCFLATSMGLVLLGSAWEAQASCTQPTKAVLIRHAETQWNILRILQGQADIPLNERGRTKAEGLAVALEGKRIDAIYSSPLSRAMETARPIATRRGLSVTARDDLREIGSGIYTGRTAGDIPPETRKSWGTDPSFALPSGVPDPTGMMQPEPVQGKRFEGESLNGVAERAWREILTLMAQNCGKQIVIVTHGGIVKIALTRANGVPVTKQNSFNVDNLSQTVLEFKPDGAVAVLPGW